MTDAARAFAGVAALLVIVIGVLVAITVADKLNAQTAEIGRLEVYKTRHDRLCGQLRQHLGTPVTLGDRRAVAAHARDVALIAWPCFDIPARAKDAITEEEFLRAAPELLRAMDDAAARGWP